RRPTFVAPDLRWLGTDPAVGEPSLEELVEAVGRAHAALDGGDEDGRSEAAEQARRLLARMTDR
ncbi:MAG: hypothetical protein IE926_17535, partial [Micrococcales bacterium]|nr:hypothetical protein [Micrococcales bacterium]